jgi:superfamily I DNA/RNA helicase/RecB family exonuclease
VVGNDRQVSAGSGEIGRVPETDRRYVLNSPTAVDAASVPTLDASQQAVIDHFTAGPGGPLQVLAGPGTGKTTTLVELVVDRIENGALKPENALVLTFSRKAAQELRSRIARRLPGHAVGPVMTFHSYCYALVRSQASPESFGDPLRLLSAPEQEFRVAEVLTFATEQHSILWPDDLAAAIRTRGFAQHIVDFLGRARAFDLDPASLRQLAEHRNEPAWVSVSELWRRYNEGLALAGEVDYAGLVDEAQTALDRADQHGELARHQPALLVVDEYQDTDPAQVALVQRLVGPTTDLVVVGDPDQSIYAFRGAEVRGMWEFTDRFGSPSRPATILPLRQTRRFGPTLLAASRAVIGRLGVSGSMSADQFDAFRNPAPSADVSGRLDVRTYTDARAEAEHIARTLRRAHLRDGIPYREMAVLVRAGNEAIAPYERALRAAGLPVEVAGDEIPLAGQPAIHALLLAARAALGLASGRDLLPEEAEALLAGPLANLDAARLRRLARELRRLDAEQHGVVRASDEVLADAMTHPTELALTVGGGPLRTAADRAERLATTLRRAAAQIRDQAPAEQVLWTLWDGTGWPRRLQRAAEAGDDTAHRDLDALVALFSDAARAEERGGQMRLRGYLDSLESQQIPADTLSEGGLRGQAVRVMTAHRSKGLEWDLVVLAGVQDGRWPMVRPASSLLRIERLDPAGDGSPPSFGALLAEERRLFYVAMTRARRRLIVTAVESSATDGEQPSRFFDEVRPLASEAPGPTRRSPSRPASLRGVVTHLRWLAEHAPDDDVRAGAAARLADLADLVPAAHPDSWWGLPELSESSVPVRDPDQPLGLSASAVENVSECGLKWFLSREAGGVEPTSSAQGFGLAVHVLAAEIVDQTSVDADELVAHLDSVWHRLDFDTDWISHRERDAATSAVRRMVRWHLDRPDGRRPVGAEVEFSVELPVGDDLIRLRGSMDRVEIDGEGRIRVVDLKTGAGKPSKDELAQHVQLGVYQVAVGHGAIPAGSESGGAELVHLRQEAAAAPGLPIVQTQPAPDADQPFFVYGLLRQTRDTIRTERFDAVPNARCDRCTFRKQCPAQIEPTIGEVAP